MKLSLINLYGDETVQSDEQYFLLYLQDHLQFRKLFFLFQVFSGWEHFFLLFVLLLLPLLSVLRYLSNSRIRLITYWQPRFLFALNNQQESLFQCTLLSLFYKALPPRRSGSSARFPWTGCILSVPDTFLKFHDVLPAGYWWPLLLIPDSAHRLLRYRHLTGAVLFPFPTFLFRYRMCKIPVSEGKRFSYYNGF